MKTAITLMLLVAAAGAQPVAPALDSVYQLYVSQEYDKAGDILARLDTPDRRPGDRFLIRLELGDLMLDKLYEYAAAESIYGLLLDEFPKDKRGPDVRYRLALAQELQEKYLAAAQNYEIVATKHMKSRFGDDALDAIERCFRKNYQDRVAYVNGFPITRIELDDRISRYPANYETYEQKQTLLDTMIGNRLLYKAALAAGVRDDSSFATADLEMRNRYVFEEWYARNITSQAEPSEKQLQGQYRKDKKTKYTTPEKVHGYQVVVATRELADSLRKVLLTDTTVTWEDVAREHSTAPDRERGGDMGFFARGVHAKAVEGQAFKLKPGQVSKPVAIDEGFALIRITEKQPKKIRSYEDAKNQIAVALRQENTNKLYEQKTAELKSKVALSIDSTAIEEDRDLLATVAGIELTRSMLDARIEQIPGFFRAQFESPEGMRRILDQMILERLILKDAEANKDWLWNNVVNKVLDRRSLMIVDGYKLQMTTNKVEIDSAEVLADYKATIADFKVAAQVHAREVVARSRERALQLRSWAVAGRLPEMILGRAVVVTGDEALVEEWRELLAGTDNTDSLVGTHGITDAPRAALPGTPTIRIANRIVPDLTQAADLAGPFGAGEVFGFAFPERSRDDDIYAPELVAADDGEALGELLDLEPDRDSTGVAKVDPNRLGTYVRLTNQLPWGFVKGLFKLNTGEVSEPHELEEGMLLVKVTQKDSAGKVEFADIARKFSTAGSRHSGGDMYWVRRGDRARPEKVTNAAFGLGTGRISRVMKTSDSTWTFIKAEEKEKAFTRPLDEARPKIEAKLHKRETKELYEELMADLLAGADIETLMTPSDFIFDIEEELKQTPEEATEPEIEE